MPENLSEARGIKNAQVRHANRRKAGLTGSRIYENVGRQHRKKGSSHQNRRTRFDRPETDGARQAGPDYNKIRQTFRDAGETLNDTDIRELSTMKEAELPKADFPSFIFTIAILSDIVGGIATLTIVGIVVAVIISFICNVILFIWTLMKLGGTGRVQKRLTNKILIRYGISAGIELIPGINIIPASTIFVLLVYYEEKKIAKLIRSAHASIHGRGAR